MHSDNFSDNVVMMLRNIFLSVRMPELAEEPLGLGDKTEDLIKIPQDPTGVLSQLFYVEDFRLAKVNDAWYHLGNDDTTTALLFRTKDRFFRLSLRALRRTL
jgi:hypothetical protein